MVIRALDQELENGSNGRILNPRNIEERSHDDEGVKNGYFMPDTSGVWNDTLDRYPETWLEPKKDGELMLRSSYKKRQPHHVRVDAEGRHTSDGTPGWYIPGNFAFCLRCGVVHPAAGKESLRLTGLSGEGRSSATTMLTLAALRYLYEEDDQLSEEAKKVLGFTDNRQDAALQVGLRTGATPDARRAPAGLAGSDDAAGHRPTGAGPAAC